MRKHTLTSPGAYAEVGQIIGLLDKTPLIISDIVEICRIILEIVQNGHNRTLLVVGEQRLKADVLKSNGTVQTITPHFQVLNSQLQIKHLQHITFSLKTFRKTGN